MVVWSLNVRQISCHLDSCPHKLFVPYFLIGGYVDKGMLESVFVGGLGWVGLGEVAGILCYLWVCQYLALVRYHVLQHNLPQQLLTIYRLVWDRELIHLHCFEV